MPQKFITRLITLSAIAATLSISSSVSAATVYQIDDGESNAAVGLSDSNCTLTSPPIPQANPPRVFGDLMWLNSFDTKTGGEFIDSIDIVWGATVTNLCTKTVLPQSGLSNEPAKIFLYTDTNQDGQLELLAEEDTIVRPPDPKRPDVFSRIVFKQRQQVSGTFFIAALFPNQKEGQYPAALDVPDSTDTQPRDGQSWIAYSVKPESLTVNPLPKYSPSVPGTNYNNDGYYAYTKGYWLLRANGSGTPPKRVPEPASAVSLVAIATLSVGTLLKRKPKP